MPANTSSARKARRSNGAADGETAKIRRRGARRTRPRRSQAAAAHGRVRLSVFRSSKHIYAQIIDDTKGVTLAAASSLEKAMRESAQDRRQYRRRQGGRQAARRAREEKGVKDVVFDRGGYLYHGRVKALADAAREGGLNF